MGAKYRIEPDVPPVLLTLQLRPDSWPEALPHVIIAGQKQETGLTYSMDQDTYVVHLQKTPTGVNSRGQVLNLPDLRLVSVNAPGVPLKDALAQVFQGSSWKYQVSSRVPDARVTYSATRQPELAALQGLLRQASTPRNPITYREGKGVIYIEPGPLAGELVVAPKGTPAAGTTVRRTTLNVMKQPLRQVAKLLQEGTGTVIQVAPNVPDVPITIRISDASVNAGLSAILESARGSLPGLTLRTRDTGVYVLELGN
jgi:type II secretory pathway component GspD/PulD (secretin)